MDQYLLEIHLNSETIFGSGESTPGLVDIEIQKDQDGLPFLKGKTIKGKLREQATLLAAMYADREGKSFQESLSRLFGESGNQSGLLAVSDAQLPPAVSARLKTAMETELFTENELIKGLTDIRSMTSIGEDGVALEGSLRSVRVLRKGLRFQAPLYLREKPEEKDMSFLALSIAMLQRLGSMQNRGKGQVECRLIKDGTDVTDKWAEIFTREVQA